MTLCKNGSVELELVDSHTHTHTMKQLKANWSIEYRVVNNYWINGWVISANFMDNHLFQVVSKGWVIIPTNEISFYLEQAIPKLQTLSGKLNCVDSFWGQNANLEQEKPFPAKRPKVTCCFVSVDATYSKFCRSTICYYPIKNLHCVYSMTLFIYSFN